MKRYLILGTLCIVAHSQAGDPTWCESVEGGGDAGHRPCNSQHADGAGALGSIQGEITGLSPMIIDRVDIYRIRICDPAAFVATTVTTGTPPTFDTQLWLFATGSPHPCLDASGVLANDDTDIGFGQFDIRSTLTQIPTDGSPTLLTTPGVYFLAITGKEHHALNVSGADIFFFASATELSGPDGDLDTVFDTWTVVSPPPAFGAYEIHLEGCALLGANSVGLDDCDGNGLSDSCEIASDPGLDLNSDNVLDVCECPEDISGDGTVGFDDLITMLADWGPCSFGPVCSADLDDDGTVGFADLVLLLAAWGPC